MQIVILDGYSVNPGDVDWSPLKKLGTLSVYDRTHPSMIEQRMRGADAVFPEFRLLGLRHQYSGD